MQPVWRPASDSCHTAWSSCFLDRRAQTNVKKKRGFFRASVPPYREVSHSLFYIEAVYGTVCTVEAAYFYLVGGTSNDCISIGAVAKQHCQSFCSKLPKISFLFYLFIYFWSLERKRYDAAERGSLCTGILDGGRARILEGSSMRSCQFSIVFLRAVLSRIITSKLSTPTVPPDIYARRDQPHGWLYAGLFLLFFVFPLTRSYLLIASPRLLLSCYVLRKYLLWLPQTRSHFLSTNKKKVDTRKCIRFGITGTSSFTDISDLKNKWDKNLFLE
jgi:hypothetical protein